MIHKQVQGVKGRLSRYLKKTWTYKKLGDKSGIALMLAITTLTFLLYLAMEVQYQTQVELIVNNNSISRLKAYYAARSGVELSLLRIKVFQQVKATVGQQLGPNGAMLNLIWNFPFAWPPMLDGVEGVDKDLIDRTVKEAKMDASYQTTISDEGTRIDINDLDSSSKAIKASTRRLILQIFENERANNENFARAHQGVQFDELVDNMIDWIDADQVSPRSGSEAQGYDPVDGVNMPPNRHFRTVDELRLVKGMNDEFFGLLEGRVTVYGAKAINPNTASADVIQSIDPSITNEIITEVLKRRQDLLNGGSFRDANDFWTFLTQKGASLSKDTMENTPIVTDAAFNFRIHSIGSFSNSVREISAIVYDIPKSAQVVATQLKKELPTTGGTVASGGTTATASPPAAGVPAAAAKGPPRIVFWTEK